MVAFGSAVVDECFNVCGLKRNFRAPQRKEETLGYFLDGGFGKGNESRGRFLVNLIFVGSFFL